MSKTAQKGFTLIELMVVIGVIALISGLAIPNFTNYIDKQTQDQAESLIRTDLRFMVSRALNGSGYISDDADGWWVIDFDAGNNYLEYYRANQDADNGYAGDVGAVPCNQMFSNRYVAGGVSKSEIYPGDIINRTTGCFYISFDNGDVANNGSQYIVLSPPGATGNYNGYTLNDGGGIEVVTQSL